MARTLGKNLPGIGGHGHQFRGENAIRPPASPAPAPVRAPARARGDVGHGVERHLLAHGFGHVVQVGFVAGGRITSRSPALWAASTFCLTPPMGSTRPDSVTSPVIATVGRIGVSRNRLTSAVVIVMPADGPSLGMAPAGKWTWKRLPSKAEGSMPSCVRLGTHVGKGDLRRLLHDVAELAGDREAAGRFAGHRSRLDEQDVAAHPGDRQAGGHAGHDRPVGRLVEEPTPAQVVRQVVDVDHDGRLAALGDLGGRLAQHLAELTLGFLDPGLAGVAVNDLAEGGVGDVDLVVAEPVAAQLAPEQVVTGDDDLLGLGVAVETDDLQPVQERPGDLLEHVGRGDEQHVRQVEVDLQVVVTEGVVLRRVEDLEQCR